MVYKTFTYIKLCNENKNRVTQNHYEAILMNIRLLKGIRIKNPFKNMSLIKYMSSIILVAYIFIMF